MKTIGGTGFRNEGRKATIVDCSPSSKRQEMEWKSDYIRKAEEFRKRKPRREAR